jgi:hypothetical protein
VAAPIFNTFWQKLFGVINEAAPERLFSIAENYQKN